jgi:hypothetical protein
LRFEPQSALAVPSYGGPLTVNSDSQVTANRAVTGKIVIKT